MIKVIFGLVILILVAVGGYFFIIQEQQQKLPPQSPTAPIPNNTVQIQPTATRVPDSKAVNELRAGGNSYLDPQGRYNFLYPNSYTLDTQDSQYIRVYKTGATQKGQTEMYDGTIVVFESVMLDGKTLEQWVNARITDSTADGTSEVIKPKKAITLNNYLGFSYTLEGLGTSNYYVLQKNPQSKNALVITYSVNDPQKQGYQREVDSILATIELLK